jgi:fructose-bisphosphate aldolase class II
MTTPGAEVDMAQLAAIAAAAPGLPLVLHGGSGLPPALRRQLAARTAVCKFNIGTELRQVFGASLRQALAEDPAAFDRIAILRRTVAPLRAAALAAVAGLCGDVA